MPVLSMLCLPIPLGSNDAGNRGTGGMDDCSSAPRTAASSFVLRPIELNLDPPLDSRRCTRDDLRLALACVVVVG